MIKRLLIDDLCIKASHWDVVVVAETEFGCVMVVDSESPWRYSYSDEAEAEHAMHSMQDKTEDILFTARIHVDENGSLTLHDIDSRVTNWIELKAATDRLAVFGDGAQSVISRLIEDVKLGDAIKRNPDFGTW